MKKFLLTSGFIVSALWALTPQAAAQASPYTPPVTIEADNTLFNNECATWNGNYDDGSDSRWSVYKPYGATAYYFQYRYDSTRDADDWLFLPDLQLEAAKYKISYAYKCQGASYPETFYVTIGQGKTCTAQTTVVASHIDFSNIVDESNTAIIDVPSAGVWNLALHATSPANRYNFFVRDIHIEKVDNDAPAEPAFSYTADGLDATVTVTFPDKTISDTAIPAATSITATVTVEGCDDTFTLTGTPGATQNFSVTFPDSGEYTVSGTVQYSDASGLHTSQPASSTITVRKKKPAFLEQGYTILPDIDQAEWMTYVDGNDDHNTFYFESNRHLPYGHLNDPVFCYEPSETMPADEWLITPVWAGSTTGAVRLSYKVATYTEGSADYDVCIAYTDNVDDLKNNVVFSETNLITNHYIQESEAFFGVEPNRQYYVAFHLKTPIYDHSVTSFMYFDLMDIKCEEADGLIPMPVTIGEITPDPDFAGLEFDVTLPAKTIINTDISAQTVYAEYTVNGEKYGVISGAPGETVHLSLKHLTLGKASLKFTTYVLEGETRHGDRAEYAEAEVSVSENYTFIAPTSLGVTTQAVFDLFTVYDRYRVKRNVLDDDNNILGEELVVIDEPDGSKWQFKLDGSTGMAEYKYSRNNYAEDWLISPAIAIENIDEYYDIAAELSPYSSSYQEKAEVYWGLEPTPEAMTNLVASYQSQPVIKTIVGGMVRFDQPCTIYVGVRACSDPDKYSLYCHKVMVNYHETAADAPGAATDIVADGKTTGENIAEVTFTFPTMQFAATDDLNGDGVIDENDRPLLAEDANLVATVKSQNETKTVTGTPGQQVSLTLDAPEGVSTITIQVVEMPAENTDDTDAPAANSLGNPGPKTSVEVFCGVHTPAATEVDEPVLHEDNLGFKLTWKAVTECANEGETHLNADGLKYRVYAVDLSTDEKTLITETAQTSADVRLTDDDQQQNIRLYSVTAFNGLESYGAEVVAIAGKPEALPMTDNFADGYAQGMFLVYGMGEFKDPAAEAAPSESGCALFLDPDQAFDVVLPKFSTEDATEGYVEFVFHGNDATAPALITIEANGDAEPTVLGTLSANGEQGWIKQHFDMPASMLGKKAVAVKATFDIAADKRFVLDSYLIDNKAFVGIDNIAALNGAVARGLDGAILLQGFAGHKVVIAATDGRTVAAVDAADTTEIIPAAPGIYVVSAPGFAAKVIVK